MLSCALVRGYRCSGYVIYCDMVLYRCDLHVQCLECLVGCVLFCCFVCFFVTLRGSSHVHWGLLFTCCIVNRNFFLMWLCWLLDWIDVVVGCSGSFGVGAALSLKCLISSLVGVFNTV